MKKALTMLYTHQKAINRGLIGHTNRRIDTQTDRQIEMYKFIYLDIFLEQIPSNIIFLQGLNISSKSFKTLSCAIVYNISIFSYSQLVSRIKFTLEKIYDNCFFCLTFWNQGIDMTRAQKLKLNLLNKY